MSLPKLESSRNVTWKVISNRSKARKSKSTERYDCKLFFRLDGTSNPIVELSITQRAEILNRRSNLTPERAKNTVNDLSVALWTKQAKAGWLHRFPSFLAETSKLQSAVYSE